MSLLEPQDWTFPVPIAYGPGRLRDIAGFCHASGIRHPLIVTDRGSASLGFIADLNGHLAQGGLASALFAGISPNPRDHEISTGRSMFRANGHDGIIAIGGGSGMDGGKAIALTANNEIPLWDFEFEQPSPDMTAEPDFPPLICVPTTAGTGAETESTAMITDTNKMMKFCIWHPELKPSLAILDPEITIGLPANLTAWTGVDAMVHAIEAYCVPGFHPLCDGLALEGLRLTACWLPRAYDEPTNLEARGGMLAGSCLAGIAFSKGLGLVHAISHMVGAEYDTQHGLTNAIILPQALRHNAPAIDDKIPAMAQAIGLAGTSFDAFDARICSMLDQLKIPRSLGDIGVPADRTRAIAAKAIQDSAAGTNPRLLTVDDIDAVLIRAISSGR